VSIEKYIDNDLINYYNEDSIHFSKDLKFYNEDIWNYLIHSSIRFNTEEIINKNNLYSLDSLRRISYNLILKETDNDELYKYYKKNKINSIYDFLIYLHEHQFNYIPLLLDKLTKSKILKINPFTEGYYVVVNNNRSDIVNIDVYKKDTDIDERFSRDD